MHCARSVNPSLALYAAVIAMAAFSYSGCSPAAPETVEDWYLARQPEYSRVLPTAADCHSKRYVYWEIVDAMQRSNAQFASEMTQLSRAIDTTSPGYQAAHDAYAQANLAMQQNLKQTLLNATGWTEEGLAYCGGRLSTEREASNCQEIMQRPPEFFRYSFYGAAEYCLERVHPWSQNRR